MDPLNYNTMKTYRRLPIQEDTRKIANDIFLLDPKFYIQYSKDHHITVEQVIDKLEYTLSND
jgi:hypothetical protein